MDTEELFQISELNKKSKARIKQITISRLIIQGQNKVAANEDD
jgi:hypothetical protein